MATYHIREWDDRYEVDEKGSSYKDGRAKRSGPLEYIRLKVHGRSLGIGWRKLISVAGRREAPGVFGIFCKLLEVAGDAKRDERGYVEDTPETPLHFLLDLEEKQVASAIRSLCKIGWITQDGGGGKEESTKEEKENSTQHNSTQLNTIEPIQPIQHSGEIPGIPGVSGKSQEQPPPKLQFTDDESASADGKYGKIGDGFAKDCHKIVKAWNKAVPHEQQVPAEGTPAIDRSYSELACSSPPIGCTEILAAITNYRRALELPKSQAHPHSLGRFLARDILEKFTPGNFNLANYDKARFARDGPNGEEPFDADATIKRLEAKGMI